MKRILAAVVLAIVSTAAAVPVATACGPYLQAEPVRERAIGIWPSIERGHGEARLTLAYPRFRVSGEHIYRHDFVVVADRNLRGLERALAAHGRELKVAVVEVRPGLWRVAGWNPRPR